MKKKIIFVGVVALLVDVVTKILIDNSFNLMETKPIIVNFFSITKVYNTGASWNILSGYRIILIIITILMFAFLVYYQTKFILNNRNILTFGLLYGGIVGNLIDRIIYGYVIDFLDFTIFGYNFPVFNFADVCIVLGIFLLIIAIYKKEDINEVNSR
ncbi:MAG: signal peptidase II [Firmicutes bacterium]|nr:signal peptidase II [Bacillota bacterium]